ncbi:C39 family peptidase [Anabaena sp. UHCC 0451]|uniref:C39 family peptidase n=1 Tax=Anabaena sp. UHCC 0451 TaxID=2055235 RepID=UPI002B1F8C8F|nr:C39 family peptidase [Anabaena sp. UHCC 0451]MEA5577833.1 C39 family peptidase [Anabaena sp. UHCC 0451]
MLDDILSNFQEWFIDNLNSEDIHENDFSSDAQIIPETSKIENVPETEFSDFNIVEVFNYSLDWFTPDNQWDIADFNGFGEPLENVEFWNQQSGQNSCAVVAQISIFESITGVAISEEEACEIAQKNGWFDPDNGTRPSDVGKLLNELGIPTEQKYDARLDDIADALEKGDRVIVALDAHEIWYPMRDADDTPIEQTNGGHAVWVTGIDTQADGSVKIILNDSGHSDGKMAVIDALDFLNAWEDYSNFIVVADAPDNTISA